MIAGAGMAIVLFPELAWAAPKPKQPYTSCLGCPIWNDFVSIRDTMTSNIFVKFVTHIYGFMGGGIFIYGVWTGAAVMMKTEQSAEHAQRFGKFVLGIIVAIAALKFGENVASLVSGFFEAIPVAIGGKILLLAEDGVVPTFPASTFHEIELADGSKEMVSNPYSELGWLVERQVASIIDVALRILNAPHDDILQFFFKIFYGLTIFIPYLFIIAIFFAFMVEALFKVTAMMLLAPFFIGAAPFPKIKAAFGQAVKVLFGAALTIIFASTALGFTMKAVKTYENKIIEVLPSPAPHNLQAEAARQFCKQRGLKNTTGDNSAWIDCVQDRRRFLEAEHNLKWITMSWQDFHGPFIMMFVLGFISILLHLGSKTLASNISGANDGAGPAAAVVMAMKGTAAMGAGVAGAAAFGQGGLGQSLRAGMAGMGGGAFVDHGGLGGGFAALRQMASRAESFSTGGFDGGGGGGGSMMDSLQKYGVGDGGGGRDRSGGGGGPMELGDKSLEKLARMIKG